MISHDKPIGDRLDLLYQDATEKLREKFPSVFSEIIDQIAECALESLRKEFENDQNLKNRFIGVAIHQWDDQVLEPFCLAISPQIQKTSESFQQKLQEIQKKLSDFKKHASSPSVLNNEERDSDSDASWDLEPQDMEKNT